MGERREWTITLDYHGTQAEAEAFFDWITDEIPDEHVPTGEGTGGMDGGSMRPGGQDAEIERLRGIIREMWGEQLSEYAKSLWVESFEDRNPDADAVLLAEVIGDDWPAAGEGDDG